MNFSRAQTQLYNTATAIPLRDLIHDLKSQPHEQIRNKRKSETLARGGP